MTYTLPPMIFKTESGSTIICSRIAIPFIRVQARSKNRFKGSESQGTGLYLKDLTMRTALKPMQKHHCRIGVPLCWFPPLCRATITSLARYTILTETPKATVSTSNGFPIHDDRQILFICLANSSIYSFTTYRGRLLPDSPTSRNNWFNWICSQEDEYPEDTTDPIPPLCSDGYWETIKSNASQWTVNGFKIDYCISERLEHECKLKMAGRLLIAIIVFNAIVCCP